MSEKTISIKQYKLDESITYKEVGKRFGGKHKQTMNDLAATDKVKVTICEDCHILASEDNIFREDR